MLLTQGAEARSPDSQQFMASSSTHKRRVLVEFVVVRPFTLTYTVYLTTSQP